MSRWYRRWSDVLGSLGEAGASLARAEYDVVSSEVRRAGGILLKALLLLLIGLFALFWAIGAAVLVVVEIAALWLPEWGAALVALALFLLTGLTLALIARRRLRSIEPPTETVRRRIAEHREWWQRRIAAVGPSRRESNDSAAPERKGAGERGPDER